TECALMERKVFGLMTLKLAHVFPTVYGILYRTRSCGTSHWDTNCNRGSRLSSRRAGCSVTHARTRKCVFSSITGCRWIESKVCQKTTSCFQGSRLKLSLI